MATLWIKNKTNSWVVDVRPDKVTWSTPSGNNYLYYEGRYPVTLMVVEGRSGVFVLHTNSKKIYRMAHLWRLMKWARMYSWGGSCE